MGGRGCLTLIGPGGPFHQPQNRRDPPGAKESKNCFNMSLRAKNIPAALKHLSQSPLSNPIFSDQGCSEKQPNNGWNLHGIP